MNDKQELKERFSRLYPDAVLYCVQLDGFSHTVYYKDKDGQRKIEGYSGYAPEQYDDFDDGIHGWNRDQCKALFLGYPHYMYQHNAKEYCYKDIKLW